MRERTSEEGGGKGIVEEKGPSLKSRDLESLALKAPPEDTGHPACARAGLGARREDDTSCSNTMICLCAKPQIIFCKCNTEESFPFTQ